MKCFFFRNFDVKTLLGVYFSFWLPFPRKHTIQTKKKLFTLAVGFPSYSKVKHRIVPIAENKVLNLAARPENEYVLG